MRRMAMGAAFLGVGLLALLGVGSLLAGASARRTAGSEAVGRLGERVQVSGLVVTVHSAQRLPSVEGLPPANAGHT
jgi:hypothetical protein